VNLGGANGMAGKVSACGGIAGVSVAGTCDKAGLDGVRGTSDG
jgi:hypothetical protein